MTSGVASVRVMDGGTTILFKVIKQTPQGTYSFSITAADLTGSVSAGANFKVTRVFNGGGDARPEPVVIGNGVSHL